MAVAKSELKALIAEGFAAQFLKNKNASGNAIAAFQGEAVAYAKAEQILNTATQDTRNELINNGLPFDASSPIEVGKFIVGILMKASSELHKLAEGAAKSSIRAEGEQRAYEETIDQLCKLAAEERAKAAAVTAAMQAAVEGGEEAFLHQTEIGHIPTRPAPRAPGQHPGPPMKARRLAEERALAEPEPRTEPSSEESKPAKGKGKKSNGASKAEKKAPRKRRAKKTEKAETAEKAEAPEHAPDS